MATPRNYRGTAHDDYDTFGSWGDDAKGNHSRHCIARGYVTKREGKPCQGCVSSSVRRLRRLVALRNAVKMTGQPLMIDGERVTFAALTGEDAHRVTFVCPLTLRRVLVSAGECDRPLTGEKGGLYRPWNVCMVAGEANASRHLAAHDVERYIRDVAAAAAALDVPTEKTARSYSVTGRQYAAVNTAAAVAAIESGPYGIR